MTVTRSGWKAECTPITGVIGPMGLPYTVPYLLQHVDCRVLS